MKEQVPKKTDEVVEIPYDTEGSDRILREALEREGQHVRLTPGQLATLRAASEE